MKVKYYSFAENEADISFVRMVVPVRYDEDDMPNSFPFRTGNTWDVTIDIETGQILDWPPLEFSGDDDSQILIFMKVTDGGSYYLLDSEKNEIASIQQNYVPHSVIPGEFGDYINLKIKKNGLISNWEKPTDVDEFFDSENR